MSETSTFRTAVAQRVLVADGAMGTTLFSLGLEGGGCPELLNVEQPDLVATVHRRFAEAGADIVLTNTFGGTSARLTPTKRAPSAEPMTSWAPQTSTSGGRPSTRPK